MSSPFEITTSATKKKTNIKGIIVAAVIILFLALSVIAGVLLVRQNQNVAEKASVSVCPQAQACPVADRGNILNNCTPAEVDNSPHISYCNLKGKVDICGGTKYCCPGPNLIWTRDMTDCPTNTPTATPTLSPTNTPTATSSATPTFTPTVRPTQTSRPIPETGTDWPTVVGGVVGVGVIIASILIAL